MISRILVAEDESAIAQALKAKLTHEGFDVVLAKDGEEALAAVKQQQFAVVLLDLIMPRMDGFAFLEHFQKQGLTTPVIVTSNLSASEEIARVKSMGAVDFIVKSDTSLADIVKKVRQHLPAGA